MELLKKVTLRIMFCPNSLGIHHLNIGLYDRLYVWEICLVFIELVTSVRLIQYPSVATGHR